MLMADDVAVAVRLKSKPTRAYGENDEDESDFDEPLDETETGAIRRRAKLRTSDAALDLTAAGVMREWKEGLDRVAFAQATVDRQQNLLRAWQSFVNEGMPIQEETPAALDKVSGVLVQRQKELDTLITSGVRMGKRMKILKGQIASLKAEKCRNERAAQVKLMEDRFNEVTKKNEERALQQLRDRTSEANQRVHASVQRKLVQQRNFSEKQLLVRRVKRDGSPDSRPQSSMSRIAGRRLSPCRPGSGTGLTDLSITVDALSLAPLGSEQSKDMPGYTSEPVFLATMKSHQVNVEQMEMWKSFISENNVRNDKHYQRLLGAGGRAYADKLLSHRGSQHEKLRHLRTMDSAIDSVLTTPALSPTEFLHSAELSPKASLATITPRDVADLTDPRVQVCARTSREAADLTELNLQACEDGSDASPEPLAVGSSPGSRQLSTAGSCWSVRREKCLKEKEAFELSRDEKLLRTRARISEALRRKADHCASVQHAFQESAEAWRQRDEANRRRKEDSTDDKAEQYGKKQELLVARRSDQLKHVNDMRAEQNLENELASQNTRLRKCMTVEAELGILEHRWNAKEQRLDVFHKMKFDDYSKLTKTSYHPNEVIERKRELDDSFRAKVKNELKHKEAKRAGMTKEKNRSLSNTCRSGSHSVRTASALACEPLSLEDGEVQALEAAFASVSHALQPDRRPRNDSDHGSASSDGRDWTELNKMSKRWMTELKQKNDENLKRRWV